MLKTKTTGVTFAIFSIVAVSLVASNVQAADRYICDGGLKYVDFGTHLQIGCIIAGTTKHVTAYLNNSTCSNYNRDIDTVKIWLSQAQAAILSGRQVHIYYETCAEVQHILAISLRADSQKEP